ncbi:MAG: hypothetical protein GOMPHAMPRED_002902 [Gomphillus americanus]|uniref:Major facilitator superfamily (MFS) profile domain-containing protein n=1 Tax=Gomphillus americanus TaxID=1940652 RepID=A0A8H3EFF7_9LECA|nr:MAG: hypothetical protein GOMPHAMPRED_002902 [Gomphillus americanus]
MAVQYSPGLEDKEAGPATRSDSLISNADIARLEKDGDQALKFITDRVEGEAIVINAETNRRLLRKIDLHIMPLMCIIYGLNFLDKTTLSYASIMGLQTDLNLVGSDYQWLSSIFYFGYLAWEFPANRLLQLLPLAKFSAFNVIMWGIVLTLFSVTSNWSGAMAIRFFLGLFESAVTPGFALFTTQWYTRKEQGFRTSIWYCFNGFAQIFGGLVAYGIAHGAETHGFSVAPWKIIFIFTGTLTIVVGITFLVIMPDSPLSTHWLTEHERVLVLERVRINQQGIGNKKWKMYQFKEALLDPMVWAFAAFALLSDIPNGGITNFFSLLLKSFGYTSQESLLYGTPAGAVEIVALLASGYLGDRLGQRIGEGALLFQP